MGDGSTAKWFALPRARASKPAGFMHFHLRLLRTVIRAWHTTMLMAVLIGQLLGMGLEYLGTAKGLLPWARGYPLHGPYGLVVACSAVALLVRAVLCTVAWSRSFASLYPRIAPMLVLLGHVSAAIAFSCAVFSGRQGYVVLVSLQVFGASILSGLSLRQSLRVNVAVFATLVLAALLLGAPPVVAVPVICAILLCCVMSGIAAWALERSSRALSVEHDRISDLAELDGLTGLNNRHAFNTHLPAVFEAAVRERRALTLLLIDVDFFKCYNDTRGHVAGDEALQAIARVIEDVACRPTEIVARYGGDEIAVVLLDATADAVITQVTRMHEAVGRLGLTLRDDDPGRRVTLSTGVAHLRPEALRAQGCTPLTALQLADRALYAAKRAGRNQFALLTGTDDRVVGVADPDRLLQTA